MKNDGKILGLSLGELSTAAILVDGKTVACVSEERFSRTKNDESYPKNAIEYCLKEAGITGKDVDAVTIASELPDLWHRLTHYYSKNSIKDYIKEQHEYWYPTLYEGKKIAWHQLYKERWDLKQYPGNWQELLDQLGGDYYLGDGDKEKVNQFIVNTIHKHIGVPKERIQFLDHHTGHAAYAYYCSPFRDGKTLVLTFDAFGDGLSATVSVAEGGEIKRVHQVPHTEFKLARMYRYITLLLGMKPNEHEYKVMGLAPYAKPQIYEKAYQVFKNTMYVDGLDFKYKDNPKDMYHYFREKLEGLRFDGIAGGLQKYTEEIITEWVRNAVKATGVSRVVISGGVSMNVKAMGEIIKMPEVTNLFVPPSGGDESLAMGAAFVTSFKQFNKVPAPMQNAYLGPDINAQDVLEVIKHVRSENKPYEIIENVSPAQIAARLAKGRVIGRAAGRMEFGARALGNRSIMADPRTSEMVRIINEKIKNRDFWMPFAPAMLREKSDKYVVNPKKVMAPYMTIAMDTTPTGAPFMKAAIHPADLTARPQFVDQQSNPGFCAILEEFDKLTGSAVLLNTSFNLHGEPIVGSAADAFRVFELTSIDDLVIGNTLLGKK